MESELMNAVAVTFGLFAATVLPVSGAPDYQPRIPTGYAPEVVLSVDYGTTPETIRVEWGSPQAEPGVEGEYVEPSCIDCMTVVKDHFYFLSGGKIKHYRSPGIFVWEARCSGGGIYSYAVSPEQAVYAINSNYGGQLSHIDDKGTVLWTKHFDAMLPVEKLRDYGLTSTLHEFEKCEWTSLGLVVTVSGDGADGRSKTIALLLDADGNVKQLLTSDLVGFDGLVYEEQIAKRGKGLASPRVGRNLKGQEARAIQPDLEAENGKYVTGNASIRRISPDVEGGLAIQGLAHLPASVPIAKGMTTGLEQVLWRVGPDGKVKEHWRFPVSLFASRCNELLVGSDGCVYYIKFRETGISVLKYSRKGKS